MASFAAKIVAKKLFKETTSNKQGQEDPYFETIPATRLGGMYKTTKKRRRALPPGLTAQEEKVLTKAKRRAYRVDLSLGSFFGTRFGWGAIIGLIPGIGDVLDLLLAFMVYRTCCSVEPELSASVKMRMKLNMAIDFGIGLVPFIGDIADMAYKCNTRNVILLEKELRERGRKRLKGTPQANVADPSLPDEFDYQNEEHLMNQQNGPPPRYTSQRESRRSHRDRGRDYDVERADEIPPSRPTRTR
ncbi:uncharacterized protein Z518_02945 [Rhinocladiella mackenziei CBS 650.93]|uniref:PH domain protein n=1 Tax=Rhinocladiella mackenziei CBS 650.93 TaxID=1442369 RepID=A0A0D2IQP1_9EURO|nr:uncharacterized protein Z518_02945 [Rhinocladiella mackenziei CBS 650.93]KIX08289.1 hypothetical protein Z518_02945 [Rhinocladiella mackenziei CBS 650.93]